MRFFVTSRAQKVRSRNVLTGGVLQNPLLARRMRDGPSRRARTTCTLRRSRSSFSHARVRQDEQSIARSALRSLFLTGLELIMSPSCRVCITDMPEVDEGWPSPSRGSDRLKEDRRLPRGRPRSNDHGHGSVRKVGRATRAASRGGRIRTARRTTAGGLIVPTGTMVAILGW